MTTLIARPLRAGRSGDQRQQLLATQHLRLMILLLFFAAGVVIVIGRLAMLGVLEGGDRGPATALAVPRGDIVDRNGAPLARTIDAWTIGVHPKKLLGDPHWTDPGFCLALERWGYDVSDPLAATVAFQRRFRPELFDGTIDGETRAILLALLLRSEAVQLGG